MADMLVLVEMGCDMGKVEGLECIVTSVVGWMRGRMQILVRQHESVDCFLAYCLLQRPLSLASNSLRSGLL